MLKSLGGIRQEGWRVRELRGSAFFKLFVPPGRKLFENMMFFIEEKLFSSKVCTTVQTG